MPTQAPPSDATYLGKRDVWLVPSRSDPGRVRIVIYTADGYACSCPTRATLCWHVRHAVDEQIQRGRTTGRVRPCPFCGSPRVVDLGNEDLYPGGQLECRDCGKTFPGRASP